MISNVKLNFLYMISVQIINFAVPILLLPFLLSVLGEKEFGIYSMAMILSGYLQVFSEYSFSITGTRKISESRSDGDLLKHSFLTIYVTKSLITIVFLTIFAAITCLLPFSENEKKVYMLSYTVVAASTFFPSWFFMGIEKMGYVSLANLLNRVVPALLLLLLISNPHHLIRIPIIYTVVACLVSFSTYIILSRKLQLEKKLPTLNEIRSELLAGRAIFSSNLYGQMYRLNPLLIMGIFVEKEVVGVFYIAKKIIDALMSFYAVVIQVLYPYLINQKKLDHDKYDSLKRRLFTCIPLVGGGVAFTLILFTDYLSSIFAGNNSVFDASLILLSFGVFFIALGTPASLEMLINHDDKFYSHILMKGTVLGAVLAMLGGKLFSFYGIALSIVLTELFVSVLLHRRTKGMST